MGNRAHVAARINNSECPFKLCGENPSLKLDCLFLAIDAIFAGYYDWALPACKV